MNKEFVPYELAVKLKQLGFDEPCFARFNNDGDLLIAHTEKYIIDNGVDRSEFFTLAPLFQQAFRWFREEHGMAGLIDIGTQEYSFFIFDEKTDSRKVTSSMNGTYEEAELECLTKLIDFKSE
jgi:hypothetical protein